RWPSSARTRFFCRPNAEGLAAHSDGNLQPIVQQKNLVLAEEGQRPLPVGRVVYRTKRRRRRLEDRFVLVFKPNGGQVVPAETQIGARVQGVGGAVVDAHKGKITKRIKGSELRIDLRSVVISPARADMLVSN